MHLLVKHVMTGEYQSIELLKQTDRELTVKWLPKGPEYTIGPDGWMDSCWRLPRETREKLFGRKK